MGDADQILISALLDDDLILNANAAPAGNVQAGLDGGYHVFLIDVRSVLPDKGNLVDKKADTVADTAVVILEVGRVLDSLNGSLVYIRAL